MINGDKDNITSIRRTGTRTCGVPKKDYFSKYTPPQTSENPSEYWRLPTNREILKHLRLAGGSLDVLLSKVTKTEQRKVLALQIIEQLATNAEDLATFEALRMAADRTEAMLAKDEIVRLSKRRGQGQLAALKAVCEFVKGHTRNQDKPVDPMDKHLGRFNGET